MGLLVQVTHHSPAAVMSPQSSKAMKITIIHDGIAIYQHVTFVWW